METANEFMTRIAAKWRPHETSLGYHGAWMIEARTLMEQTGFPEYVTSIERLRRVGDGAAPDVQYRLSFYARGQSGMWTWARRPPVIPAADLEPLLAQAREDGTIL